MRRANAFISPRRNLEEERQLLDCSVFLSLVSYDSVSEAVFSMDSAAAAANGGRTGLRGVFYFSREPPAPGMPWRPRYSFATLLCVCETPEVAAALAGRMGQLYLEKPEHLGVVPKSAQRDVNRALHTFLTGGEVVTYASVLLHVDARRNRYLAAVNAATDLPPISVNAAMRLYAAVLCRRSGWSVDWFAARAALVAGTAVEVPEREVGEAWVRRHR